MDISKIDKNFRKNKISDFKSNIYKLPNENFTLLGGYFDEKFGFIKMPDQLSSKVNEGAKWATKCGVGIRLLFSTDSKSIKVSGEIFDKCLMNHMAFIGSSCFTLCEVVGKKEIFICNLCPDMDKSIKFVAQGTLNGNKMRNYILYFPLYSGIVNLTIELDENSKVLPYNKYKNQKPILYYGSSITQGGCASKPNNCYEALVSEWLNIDYYVIGISGNAKGETVMAEYLRDLDCSIFVCDYDYNAPDYQHLVDTHLRLYKIFRSGKNKDVPILFISKPDAFRHKKTDIPRFEVIKDTYNYALSHGDKNVYLLDGSTIYPKSIREHCSVDGCHPTDLGFYYFAKKVYNIIKKIK